MPDKDYIELGSGLFVNARFRHDFEAMGLGSLEDVFSFSGGRALVKDNLGVHRSRIVFVLPCSGTTVFLKRYDKPPITGQLKNWFQHRRRASSMSFDLDAAESLSKAGIPVAEVICYGRQWGLCFEKRSFIGTRKIDNAESLERKLPGYFYGHKTPETLRSRRRFISNLARFAHKFHQTGYRHRDFYFCHIFCDHYCRFHLIDLHRVFKPRILKNRFRIKDIAQLCYSARGSFFSRTDRLRFYLSYAQTKKLRRRDKAFIRKVITRVHKMARHDSRHGRTVPFSS
ncbi:MAG: lipopolysaccharide kinase InaA family protein [Planctomycetota bacterium]